MAKNKIDSMEKKMLVSAEKKKDGNTPPLAEQGIDDNKTPPPPAGQKPEAVKKKPSKNELKAASYAKLYPDCPAFHITSDGQVFLDRNINDAIAHQCATTPTESVETIKVK